MNFRIFYLIGLLLITLSLHSQIKVSEPKFVRDSIFQKPEIYDGHSDLKEQFGENIDYSKYIGYNIFFKNKVKLITNKVVFYELNEDKDSIFTRVYKPHKNFDSSNKYTHIETDTLRLFDEYKILNIFSKNNLDKDQNIKKDFIKNLNPKINGYGDIEITVTSLKRYSDGQGLIEREISGFNNSTYFQLLNIKTKDTVYYPCFHNKFNKKNDTDFIFMPYYKSLVEKFDNKKFIFFNEREFKDLYTHKIFVSKKKSIWSCKLELMDLDNYSKDGDPMIWISHKEKKQEKNNLKFFCVLKNEEGNIVAIPFEEIWDTTEPQKKDGTPYYYSFVDYDVYKEIENNEKLNIQQKQKLISDKKIKEQVEATKYKKELENQYGKSIAKLILEKKVSLGMTKELCQLAWGLPIYKTERIDNTGNYENWFYGGKIALSFFNNKLIEINK